jgi:hypothetical protein
MGVPTSWRILGGKWINDTDLWRPAKNSIQIDGLDYGSLNRRNQLQFPQKCLNVLGLLALNATDDNVFPALKPPSGFVEHAIRLAYAGSIAQKNLEFRAPPLVLLRLHLLEEPLGTWSRELGYAHCVRVPATV